MDNEGAWMLITVSLSGGDLEVLQGMNLAGTTGSLNGSFTMTDTENRYISMVIYRYRYGSRVIYKRIQKCTVQRRQ